MSNLQEIWKDIPHYENYYQVSDQGRIKSIPRLVSNFRGGKYFTKERILRPRITPGGYVTVMLWKENKSNVFQVHRLVAEAFIPNLNNLPQVNHKKGNKLDNRACMLEWCDQFANMKHAIKTGLAKKPPVKYGADNHKAKKIIDNNTGKVYSTIKEAMMDLNISRTKAGKILNGTHTLSNLKYSL